jgi:hypothetical protein
MCDPVTLGIASTVVGAAGSAANAAGMRKAQKQQANEVSSWQRQQTKFRQDEQGRQEELRQGAEQAQQQGLEQISGEAQAKRQAEEEARLASYLQGDQQQATQETGGAPVSVADKSLSGQSGGGEEFKTDLAKKINDASKGAKERLGALARVSSYGDSFGGLGTTNPLLQQAAGGAIDRQNEFRRGSLGAYNVERAIEPVQVSYTPSPMADIFSSALSFGGQALGNSFGGGTGGLGSLFSGNKLNSSANKVVNFSKVPTKAATTGAWNGLRAVNY